MFLFFFFFSHLPLFTLARRPCAEERVRSAPRGRLRRRRRRRRRARVSCVSESQSKQRAPDVYCACRRVLLLLLLYYTRACCTNCTKRDRKYRENVRFTPTAPRFIFVVRARPLRTRSTRSAARNPSRTTSAERRSALCRRTPRSLARTPRRDTRAFGFGTFSYVPRARAHRPSSPGQSPPP